MDFWCRSSSGSFSQLSSFLSSSSSLSSGDVRRASTIPRTRRTTKRANNWRRAIPKFEFSSSRRRDGGGCKNAWIHSVQRQTELRCSMWLRSLVDVVKCQVSQGLDTRDHAIEWTSNQRAFKDSKVARNVFRLTLCVRGGGGNSNSKTEKYLSVSFVSKPWKARTVARAATTQKKGRILIVIVSRPEPDLSSFTWNKTGLWSLRETSRWSWL